VTDWITGIIASAGYWGVGLLMFFETMFPPIPSEVIMPLAGVYAAQQDLTLWGVILAGTVGALVGNVLWFVLAWKLGLERFEQFLIRYGRIFTMDETEIARGRKLFADHGGAIVGVGRVIPTIRSLISVPAGLVRMEVRTFLFYTSVGTFVWTMGLAVAGYLLGTRFADIDRILGPLSTAVIGICIAVYLYRVVTWKKRKAVQ